MKKAVLKVRRFFRRKGGVRALKKLLAVALTLALTTGFVAFGLENVPSVIGDLTLVSSLFALPEGTGAKRTEAKPLPEPTPPHAEQAPPAEESPPTEQEAVSGAIVTPETEPPALEVKESDRGRIIEEKFSSTADKSAVVYKNGTVKNYTDLTLEKVESILKTDWGERLVSDSQTVQVLIMHTHTTESYEPYDRDYYDKNYSARTLDEEYNMVRVGNSLAKALSENGIGVVHDTTVHDYPSYNGSYERSAETVKGWLEKYPTVKVVIDLHRDAVERTVSGKTVRVKPTTEIDGKKAAQLMIIAGCDDGEMGMPNWKENLRFGAALQNQLETDYKSITRPLMFDYRKYNQDLTTGSILVEVGGHANSLDEAVYSAELLGRSLARLLKTYMD